MPIFMIILITILIVRLILALLMMIMSKILIIRYCTILYYNTQMMNLQCPEESSGPTAKGTVAKIAKVWPVLIMSNRKTLRIQGLESHIPKSGIT